MMLNLTRKGSTPIASQIESCGMRNRYDAKTKPGMDVDLGHFEYERECQGKSISFSNLARYRFLYPHIREIKALMIC
jgi:hypothetical protein